MSKSVCKPNSKEGLESGVPQQAVQLCYWQICAGQHAAGLSRPLAHQSSRLQSKPPLLSSRPLQKTLRRITDPHQRAQDITHTSRPAKKIWLKAYYCGKVGGKKIDLAGTDSDIFLKIIKLKFKALRVKYNRSQQSWNASSVSKSIIFYLSSFYKNDSVFKVTSQVI